MINLNNFKIPEIIEGKNIFLCKIDIKEAPELFDLLKEPEITRFLKINPPESMKEEKSFIKAAKKSFESSITFTYSIYLKYDSDLGKIIQQKEKKQGSKLPGILCGTISLWNLNYKHKFAEIGIWIGKNFWGKGVNYEAIRLIMILAFDILRLNRLEATMSSENIRSIKTFEKLNFTQEGKLRKKINIHGKYHDVLYYSFLHEEYK